MFSDRLLASRRRDPRRPGARRTASAAVRTIRYRSLRRGCRGCRSARPLPRGAPRSARAPGIAAGKGAVEMRRVVIEQAANVGFGRLLVVGLGGARGEQMPRDDIFGIEGEEPTERRLVEPPGPAGGARETLVGVDVIGRGFERARKQRGRFLEA